MPFYALQCSQASNRTAFSICNIEQATKEPLKIEWNHSRAIRHTDKSALRNTHRFVEVKGRILRREWHSLGRCWHPCSPDDTSADYWSILYPAASLMVQSLKRLEPQHVPTAVETTSSVGRVCILMTDGSCRGRVTPASPHSCSTKISLTSDLILGSDSRIGTSGVLPYYRRYTHTHTHRHEEESVDRWL